MAFVELTAAIVVLEVLGVTVVVLASVMQLLAYQYYKFYCCGLKIWKYSQSRTETSVLQKFGAVARMSQY